MPGLAALPKMVIEVAVFAVLIYLVLRFLRETRGSGVVRGLALLLVVGFVGFQVLIQVLKLERLEQLFNLVAQSVVIALVIVFHPEIRRAIVHLGDSPIFGRFFPKESKIVQRVLRAVARLGKERIGALIAIERDASLQSLVESGITIDAELNSFLIESIFYPKSALHDGAIVVREDRIVAASCLLPLSQNPDVDKRLGTRHRAALGLSEETDALAIVVSEETGKISAALGGKLHFDLTLEQLERHIDEALGLRQRSADAGRRRRTPWAAIVDDPWRKLAAVVLGIGTYYVLDYRIRSTVPFPMVLQDANAPTARNGEMADQRIVIPLRNNLAVRKFVDPSTGGDLPADGVTLRISGPKYEIEALKSSTMTMTVALPTIDWDRSDSIEFSVEDLRAAGPSARQLSDPAITMTMEPPKVRILVDRIETLEVTLAVDRVEINPPPALTSRLRLSAADFTPDIVRVLGKKTILDALRNEAKPFRVQLQASSDRDRQISGEVVLKQRFRDAGLRLDPPSSLTVPLTPDMDSFTFRVPVRIDDLALAPAQRGQFVADGDTEREVEIRAGGALLGQLIPKSDEQRQEWVRQHLRLTVWLDPQASSYDLPLVPRLELVGATTGEVDPGDYALADQGVTIYVKKRP